MPLHLETRCPKRWEEERHLASATPDLGELDLGFPPEQPDRGNEGRNDNAFNKVTSHIRRYRLL
jgi:hypothetical protein